MHIMRDQTQWTIYTVSEYLNCAINVYQFGRTTSQRTALMSMDDWQRLTRDADFALTWLWLWCALLWMTSTHRNTCHLFGLSRAWRDGSTRLRETTADFTWAWAWAWGDSGNYSFRVRYGGGRWGDWGRGRRGRWPRIATCRRVSRPLLVSMRLFNSRVNQGFIFSTIQNQNKPLAFMFHSEDEVL